MVEIALDDVSVGYTTERGDARVAVLDAFTLHVASGELLALVGPSGSGKTTVLRTIAGLQRPHTGTVTIDGEGVDHLTPGERDVAMVAQSTTLLAHLSVEDNLGFALRLRDVPQGETNARVRAEARVLGLWSKLRRRPRELSSGQRRMTALGKATARVPRVFLFDEPLAGLDARERDRVRRQLRDLQRGMGITTIYVTHDQRDAMALADRIAIMDRGRIVQIGATQDVYADPTNLFVAQFLSTPPLGVFRGHHNDDGTTSWIDTDGTALRLHPSQRAALRRHRVRGEVVVGLRSAAVALDPADGGAGRDRDSDDGPTEDGWTRPVSAVVARLEPLGATTTVELRPAGAAQRTWCLYTSVPPTRRMTVGDAVTATVDLQRAFVFDAASGARLFPPRST